MLSSFLIAIKKTGKKLDFGFYFVYSMKKLGAIQEILKIFCIMVEIVSLTYKNR